MLILTLGRWSVRLLVVIAKVIGGMQGTKTFDHDNATSVYRRRDDYRP